MKKIIFVLLLVLLGLNGQKLLAQKFAYVDSEYILANIPEYETAQKQLDEVSVTWQKELENKFSIIDKMYKDYQAEKVLLTTDLQRKREEEIIAKEKEAKELQKKYFGKDGDLVKKREELVKPIQDKVYNAISVIAETKGLGFVFDKTSDNILFVSEKYDISDEVLKSMGYKADASKKIKPTINTPTINKPTINTPSTGKK